jgi:hypothetical protein
MATRGSNLPSHICVGRAYLRKRVIHVFALSYSTVTEPSATYRETERERESERLSLFVYRHGRTWSNARHVMMVPVMACASASKGTGVNKTAVITCGPPHHTEREGGRERERGREGEREGGGERERYTQTDRQTDRHRPIPRRIICCVNE